MTATDSTRGHRTDWLSVLIFLALMVIGWVNIYAAVYDDSAVGGFAWGSQYGMQLIWICISLLIAGVIMLIDKIYIHQWTYPIYVVLFLLLLSTLVIGKEVNGAKAWLVLGPVSLQPAEFMKLGVSLALARYMSEYSFSLRNPRSLLGVAVILALPMGVIMLQPDMGSAIVYCSFLVMFYREGLNKWVYYILCVVVAVFLLSFFLTPSALLVLLLVLCVVWQALANGNLRESIIYLAAVLLISGVIYFGINYLLLGNITYYSALLWTVIPSLVVVAIYAFRTRLMSIYAFMALLVGSILFSTAVDYVFNDLLAIHQQKRILDLLGIEQDPQNWGYNVNQSKIAIGSGGFSGKGFLEGTQTKYDFVPEQSTDFIFCTVGEEWGFLGSSLVLILFAILITRLMIMGERQGEPFKRIYCYSVAGIFLFHVAINVGMTIGLMPVIGIPLPLFSYGGSSLLAFTVLFFIAVKLDSE
ncbi:MAG: rod shape-determining protein RodA [Tidjanibacter sp.]|nr:rod shape-determining protein RodA [Tidjanibacter sp.]MBR7102733.1 rod shape-determining protein RodA [Tidjanibacter sp.]